MGFAELFVIAIVGLIVVGPEKLPETIKTCIVWFSRIKRTINDTKVEFEQQLGVDEIRREIHNEQVMESLRALKIAKEQAEQKAKDAGEQVVSAVQQLDGLIEPEDDGLFGDQKANHPPETSSSKEPSPETKSS